MMSLDCWHGACPALPELPALMSNHQTSTSTNRTAILELRTHSKRGNWKKDGRGRKGAPAIVPCLGSRVERWGWKHGRLAQCCLCLFNFTSKDRELEVLWGYKIRKGCLDLLFLSYCSLSLSLSPTPRLFRTEPTSVYPHSIQQSQWSLRN